jgi:hypothetical protein
MTRKYQDLQSLWDKLHTDCSQKAFNALIHRLFSHYVIKRGEVEFRFLEVEIYYFGDNHQDWRDEYKKVPFVYERYCEHTGAFFQHQSGVDICFVGNVTADGKNSNGGGVLIRTLLRKEGDKESVVTGPWDCADALFQYMTTESVPVLFQTDQELCSMSDILHTKRCNANCLLDTKEDLCFYDKRFVYNGKWSSLSQDGLERYNTTKRTYTQNTYNNKPWNYGKGK